MSRHMLLESKIAVSLLRYIYDYVLNSRKVVSISYIICNKLVVYYFIEFWNPEPHGMFCRLQRMAHLKQ